MVGPTLADVILKTRTEEPFIITQVSIEIKANISKVYAFCVLHADGPSRPSRRLTGMSHVDPQVARKTNA